MLRIFGPKREEGGSRKRVHNDELHSLYSSPNVVTVIKARRMRWAGHVARMGEGRCVYRVLVGRPEGKRPLGRPRRRWEDNIKMDLREIGMDGVNWIQLAHDRVQWRACVKYVCMYVCMYVCKVPLTQFSPGSPNSCRYMLKYYHQPPVTKHPSSFRVLLSI
jgi:hypothetical protein